MPAHDTSTTPGGRIWLITGASSGFGRSLADAALAAGDTVVAAVRRPEVLAEYAAAHAGRLVPVALDVVDTARAAEVVAEVVERFGRIDVLVNNAGRGLVGAVEETSDAELRDLMDLHFFGPAALVRAVLPHMREQKSGAVVQMSSMGGRLSFPGVGAYSATKFALEGLTEALAGEVAAYGITCLIVEPGAFRTGFAGAGALQSTATVLPAYADTVGPVRTGLPDSDGSQAGDPAKAAAAILTALDAERTPLRLALGNDAVDAIRAHADAERADAEAWEAVGRATVFDV
ncbi:oxidoreductase [Streptomyces sp. WAC06614]|uniref:oxidoreductase n=1 Tax=Streptomyces sp. WAC06614 TaxID=2487416 RepID=UPI000F787F30|nr:oxidoreductase [Streptomyces sp. WAC06614]RSS57872.1 SDR family NAD(P)-dependent oxidoreductase [Streptomyces sp. WAC06614]